MEKEKEIKHVENHFEAGSNCQVFNGNISGCVFAMPGANVTQQATPPTEPPAKAADEGLLSSDALAGAIQAVQADMWAASAYAVLFCECRDHRGYPNNMAQFERDVDVIARQRHLTYTCSAGTLSDAFRHNAYLGKHVDKWPAMGVKTRVMHLLQKFQAELP